MGCLRLTSDCTFKLEAWHKKQKKQNGGVNLNIKETAE
jgi:hypothetical protein